jgi:hypothetical protein
MHCGIVEGTEDSICHFLLGFAVRYSGHSGL